MALQKACRATANRLMGRDTNTCRPYLHPLLSFLGTAALRREVRHYKRSTHPLVTYHCPHLASKRNDLQVEMMTKPCMISGSSRAVILMPSKGMRLSTRNVRPAGAMEDAYMRISLNLCKLGEERSTDTPRQHQPSAILPSHDLPHQEKHSCLLLLPRVLHQLSLLHQFLGKCTAQIKGQGSRVKGEGTLTR